MLDNFYLTIFLLDKFYFILPLKVMSDNADRILIMAATNRPWELDDAALRYACNVLIYHLAFCVVFQCRPVTVPY